MFSVELFSRIPCTGIIKALLENAFDEAVYGLQVLSNSLFAGLSRAQCIQSEREHSQHLVWSTDFRSQMSNALDSFDLNSVDIIKLI